MPSDLVLRGVYIPLITPFEASGGVAVDAIERLAHGYLDAGAAGIVALGTTGESAALDAEEKRAVVDVCSRVCSERSAPLIVGAGTNSTRTTVAAVQALAGTPALAAVLIVVPYYVRPSGEGVVAHFEAVAAASPVPLVLYNIPARTGCVLGPAGILHVAAHPNVAGLKQSVAGLDLDTLEVLRSAPAGFHVLGGEDAFLYPLVLMGGSGAVAAAAHVCTERFVAMIECGLTGKVDDGRALASALLPVVRAGFAEPNPAVWKGALHAQGRIPTPDVRAPMTNATPAAVDALLAAVDAAG